jgi:hypothetical protein
MKLPGGNAIFTIGHSTRTLTEFVALLRQVHITLLVDVRSIPRSRTTPQFNGDTLPGAFADEYSRHFRRRRHCALARPAHGRAHPRRALGGAERQGQTAARNILGDGRGSMPFRSSGGINSRALSSRIPCASRHGPWCRS